MTDKTQEALKLAQELALDVRANANVRLAAKAIALTGVIDSALAEQPAQQEQVADKHQAFIDSIPSDMEYKMFEQIHYWARQSYARHQRSTRGQMITAADSSDYHIIWAALRWAKENAATPQAQRTWVGLTPEQRATIAEANNMLVDDDLFDAIEAELKEKNT